MTFPAGVVAAVLFAAPAVGAWAGARFALRGRSIKAIKDKTSDQDYMIHVGIDSSEAEAAIKRLEERVAALSKSWEAMEARASKPLSR